MAETTKNPETKRVAVVTGANKGIGFEISKQLASNGVKVILTARDVKRGTEAVEILKAAGYSDLSFHQLDVSDPVSISAFVNFIKTEFGKLDILVNNAAVNGLTTVGTVDPKDLKFGPDDFISNENAKKKLEDGDGLTEEKVDEVVEEYLEDVKENLIEAKGWRSNNFSAYPVSKTVLNAYTRVLAKKYPTVAINAVSPGFTKTDLNYNAGVLTTEEAAKGPVMLALMPDSKPSGLFFDRTEVSTF
ncbi:salutaridine reductase isoform X2 [Quercus suber]|uniref:salutaridine reductase isoform X2 n=1 Tax=Quercus suber TaxID=58331 RepID=UPI0032DF29C5